MNLEKILSLGRKIIPKKIFRAAQPFYHFLLAFAGAIIYRFPSKKLHVVAITGTKGKSTTAELVNAVLEEAGHTTALLGTVRFKMAGEERKNLFKMTIPGRFFVHKFLREAVQKKCDYAILEMTSEGAKQFRHKFIDFDSLIFTNLSPEHIESHGSYEKYRDAKLSIARAVSHSKKRPRILVVNGDDDESERFLETDADVKISYSIKELASYKLHTKSIELEYKNHHFDVALPGLFNTYNALAAIEYAETQNIPLETVKQALNKISGIRGRVEFVDIGQEFDVVVDYAHTPDSLEKFYRVFEDKKNICVLGNTGGGRDAWKRPEMARIAEENCEYIILTNEDPYDEDPKKILADMAEGIKNKEKLEIIMDRREAISNSLKKAKGGKGDAVLITGKGTDPYIMEADGKKTPWDDARIVREELGRLGYSQ